MTIKDLIFWYTGIGVWAVIAIVVAVAVLCAAVLAIARTWYRINRSFSAWYLCKRLKENSEESLQEIRNAGESLLCNGNIAERREVIYKVMEVIGQRMLKNEKPREGVEHVVLSTELLADMVKEGRVHDLSSDLTQYVKKYISVEWLMCRYRHLENSDNFILLENCPTFDPRKGCQCGKKG